MRHGDSGDNLIVCRNLQYTTGTGNFMLQCSSFQLKKGEVVGLVGLNGSGKTTLLKCLSSPSEMEGTISYDDLWSVSEPLYVSPTQLSSLGGDVIVADYYSLAYTLHGYKMLPVWNRTKRLEQVLLRLSDYESREQFSEIAWSTACELSSGERQRLLLADLLLAPRDILLLDEPAAHFDFAFEARLLTALGEKARKTEGAAVVVSHNLGLLGAHVDRSYAVKLSISSPRRAVVEEYVISEAEQTAIDSLMLNQ